MYYTKYRPQKFSEITKPSDVCDALVAQVISGKTVHAYLFVGPRGTGKTSMARILAKALNCPNLEKNGDPCGKCDVCTAVQEGTYLDLHEIDAASNRGIDDIRELKDKIKLAPSVGKVKIYIIDEVHMLTTEAFNAMLKTLEEPPKNTVFILCTTELHKVPETIKSRCQLFKFKRGTSKQIEETLSGIVKQEKAKISKEDLAKIARASVGGYRDALTLLQQVIEGEIAVDTLININSKHKFEDLARLLLERNAQKSIELVNSVFDDGIDLTVWTGELIRYLRSMILLKSGVVPELLDFPEELLEDKELLAKVQIVWLVDCIEKFVKAYSEIKTSYIAQMPLEIAILSIIGDRGEDIKTIPLESKRPTPPEIKSSPNVKTEPIADEPKADLNEKPKEGEADDTVEISAESLMSIEAVSEKWADVLSKVREINSSVQALLKSGKPSATSGKFIILEVYYAFHKERLETPKNRNIIEKALHELFGMPLSIKCELSSSKPKHLSEKEVGVLTDYNVVVPGGEKFNRDQVLTMLDGGLPL